MATREYIEVGPVFRQTIQPGQTKTYTHGLGSELVFLKGWIKSLSPTPGKKMVAYAATAGLSISVASQNALSLSLNSEAYPVEVNIVACMGNTCPVFGSTRAIKPPRR
jgi:hypothetical protein